MEFQDIVGYPDMNTRIFRIKITDRETKRSFSKYVPANNPAEAERKSREAIASLTKHQDPSFWSRQKATAVSTFEPKFEGNGTPLVPQEEETYVVACPGCGINLDIRELGSYSNCKSCSQKEVCLKEAKRNSL